MTMKIHADKDVCQGFGNCALAAPEYFDVDDDGIVVVLEETVPAEKVAEATEAVRWCPIRALEISAE